ncbi:MAG: ABC transporter permease [Anaerolineae bacterium]
MNWTRILTIARHEYLTNLRKPRYLIFTLSVPALALLTVAVGTVFGSEALAALESQLVPENQVVGIVDQTGELLPVLPAYDESIRAYDDEAAGRTALQEGTIRVLYVFPEEFIETGAVTVVRLDAGNSFDAPTFIIGEYVRERLLAERLDPDLQARVLNPLRTTTEITLDGSDERTGDASSLLADFIVPYMFALLLAITIFSSSGFLLSGVAEEKGSRVIEILLSSVTASELLTGKVLGLGALGLTRFAFWVASLGGLAYLGAQVSPLPSFVSLEGVITVDLLVLSLVYYLLGYLIYSLLLGAGGALGGSVQESQQIGSLVSLFAALPLYLFAFTITNPNAPIVRIVSYFPLPAPTAMVVRLPFGTIPPIDIAISIGVCVLTLPLIVWGGAKVFRAGLLNYGKRPPLAQVLRMIFR